MLAANELTCRLLSKPDAASIEEHARRESARSFDRYIAETNCEPGYLHAHAQVEYDGHILRCVPMEPGDTRPAEAHVRELEAFYAKVDPFSPGSPGEYISEALKSGVLWWYDIDHLTRRYSDMKERVLQLALHGRARLARVPVVVGGDWQFNAWACPAGHLGDFVMVNLGIIHLFCYAAMFLEIVNGSDEGRDSSPVSIVASSMLWQGAIVLGCKAMQWGNLTLPSTEHDRIWRAVQHPTEQMRKTRIMIDAFIMLHELGHIACGHTDVLRQWMQEPVPSGDAAIDRRHQMQAMEVSVRRTHLCTEDVRLYCTSHKGGALWHRRHRSR